MRHLKSGRKLGRTYSHRKAMLANLAMSILSEERVKTTTSKAKEVRSVVERLITYGKKGNAEKSNLHYIRLAARTINSKDILMKLFNDIAPRYKDRDGGYTRIVKLGDRHGDNAEISIIELVGRNGDDQRKRKKKKGSSTAKKNKIEKTPEIVDEEKTAVEEKSAVSDESTQDVENTTAKDEETISTGEAKSEHEDVKAEIETPKEDAVDQEKNSKKDDSEEK